MLKDSNLLRTQMAQFNTSLQTIEKIYEDYAKSVGLTYMSLTVLHIICDCSVNEQCTQKLITEKSHYNKQVVNVIIKGFYEKGYILLEELKEDRRNKKIVLTEKGKNYAKEILLPLWEIEEQALSVLKDSERVHLLDMLARCADGYKDAFAKKDIEINAKEPSSPRF